MLSRRWALVLIAVGAWNWVIWPRFALAIWQDPRAWQAGASTTHDSAPTSFLWVHAILIAVSLTLGTVIGVLGVLGVRAWRAVRSAGS
jgi:hypothetical protein